MQFSHHPKDISQNRGIRPQSRIPCLSPSRTAPQSFLDFRDLENHRPIILEKSFDGVCRCFLVLPPTLEHLTLEHHRSAAVLSPVPSHSV